MKWIRVNAYTVGLVFRNGVYKRMLKEGTYWLKWNSKVYIYDITKQFMLPAS